ncbi:MAG TPA: hypothetical protein VKB86_11810 [Pyrinomonadaceae bacterium]|nr:hypothetical protein [Pyrinomonadaceae bacterium]
MSKRLLSILGGIVLSLASVSAALAQQTTTTVTTTTPTTVTQTTQNPDGTYTVVEYPVGKEVTVNLTPTGTLANATGTATVMHMANGTTVKLNLTGLPTDVSTVNLYAVDPTGAVSLLGPVTVTNGTGTFTTTTPLNKFMMVLSPEANLTAYGPDTNVLFRSAVPTGMAVIPYAARIKNNGAIGENVRATTTAASSPYTVPMLGIPSFQRGHDTTLRINFSGDLAGSRANAFIEPRKDGPTQIRVRFHDLKDSNTANTRITLWAVGPDNTIVKLGQIINTGRRNETEIKAETALTDFGLFITAEPAEANAPTTTIMGTFIK